MYMVMVVVEESCWDVSCTCKHTPEDMIQTVLHLTLAIP